MKKNAIHPTAVIAENAHLGKDVTIGPFAVIEEDVEIGDRCRIGPHAVLHRFTRLGADCAVHAGAILGDVAQDLEFDGSESFVEVGEGCIIREGVTIHRGTRPGSTTRVGDHCFLMAFSHLAHNVELAPHVILANGVLLAGYVQVGGHAFISGNAIVHQFTRIGRLAMLGGGSGIGMDVPPFCTAGGVQRNHISGLNVVGLRRAGIPAEQRKQIKQAFHLLYKSNLSRTDAAAEIRSRFAAGPALEFAEFIEQSKRGICGQRENRA